MTTKLLERICELAREGWCDAEIGRRLSMDASTVRRWRNRAGVPKGMSRNARVRYTFYLRSTGEYLCEGTAKECAEMLGIQYCSIHNIICRTKQGKLKKYEIHKVEE